MEKSVTPSTVGGRTLPPASVIGKIHITFDDTGIMEGDNPPQVHKNGTRSALGVYRMRNHCHGLARLLSALMLLSQTSAFSSLGRINRQHHPGTRTVLFYGTTTTTTTTSISTTTVGPRIPINENYPGLKKVHSNPDIFIIEDFLDATSCQDMRNRALDKKLERSPVAYAGWTQDFKDLVELAAKGPIAWLALIGAWLQVKEDPSANQVSLVLHSLQNYAIIFVLVTAAIAAFTYSRAEGLKSLRTSTSTTLDDLSDATSGTTKFVQNAAILFQPQTDRPLQDEARLFEAPTVIRYEPDQVLAPHFDANRSAETEDANRGGQTLATLLVYLNDVEKGGLTRFGRLPASSSLLPQSIGDSSDDKLTVRPKQGDALLFFPADARGQFDERTEHEGCPAIDEKWIARIWRHKSRVPPPFGLSDATLEVLNTL